MQEAILKEQESKLESKAKTARVADYKKEIISQLVELIKEFPIIGIVNMENFPAKQLQKLRANLRGKVVITMTKRRLISIAIDNGREYKKDIEKLKPYLKGMPGLIFTKDNPFRLYRLLQKSKGKAFAKPNQIAPDDITIQAGPTPFAPGPIIGELASIGIKSGVEGGKVAIKQDSLVVKKGQQIKPKVAEILTRLGIEPMEIGLDITAIYEEGILYTKGVLGIDEAEFINNLSSAHQSAFGLAINIAYTTKETIKYLIGKAFQDAKSLGISKNILEKGIIENLIAKANMHANALKSLTSS